MQPHVLVMPERARLLKSRHKAAAASAGDTGESLPATPRQQRLSANRGPAAVARRQPSTRGAQSGLVRPSGDATGADCLVGPSLRRRAQVRRSFIITTVRDESQVTPQGPHR